MDPAVVVQVVEAEVAVLEAHPQLVHRHRLPVAPPGTIDPIPVPVTNRINRRRIARRRRRSARKRI